MGSMRRRTVAIGAVAGIVAQAWVALAQSPIGGPAARSRAVATVGAVRIDAAEFERRVQSALQQYTERGTTLPAEARPLLRRQVLEAAIRGELLALEAARTGALVPVAEAEEAMKRDPFFRPNGRFDETRWLGVQRTQKAQFDAAVARMRGQLSGQRMSEQLLTRFSPSEAQLRAEAEGQVSRVDVGHLTLRRADFDGSFPEPREQAVFDRYREHRSWYARPTRLTLSVVLVNTPGLTQEERRDAARVREWNARMRRSADSLLAAARGGADLERLAIPHGGVRPKTVVTPTDMPAFWKGDDSAKSELFATARGAYLARPAEATEGYLVARVDEREEAHVATLAEVAQEIRSQLREDLKRNHVDYELRDLYAAMKDTLHTEAWRVRWVFADPQKQSIREPSSKDVEAYYRSRLADYSRFDSEQGRIVATPLSEVRDDVLSRLRDERRADAARAQADRVHRAWSAGRRETSIERELGVRESIPTPRGAALDATAEGAAAAAAMWATGLEEPTGTAVVTGGGVVVWHAFEQVRDHVPTFEQAQPLVRRAFERDWVQREERGARALFDAEPDRFRSGNIIKFRRAAVTPPELLDVPLSRAEVEAWFEKNLDQFSAPEEMRARHILVSPTGTSEAADRAARVKAEALLARARGGEDFAKLAQEASDDEPTRARGGDLGTFGRGVMLHGFEAAAFAMRPGQISDLVRTEAGYHIIQCLEYEPAIVQPLDLIYVNVASDLARVKADTLAGLRADSLMRANRTPAAMAAALTRMGYEINAYEHRIGDPINSSAVRPFFDTLERQKPGQILQPAFRTRGQGVWIAWVDSITPPRTPSWEEAQPRALQAYRSGAGQRALEAKRAEMDSLLASGWSADTLAALWGGLTVVANLTPGRGFAGLGGAAVVDSFVFGGAGRPAAREGETSGWLDLPNGISRVTILQRQAPDLEQLRARMQELKAEHVEVGMRAYFADLAQRHPVRILDPVLRDTPLPKPHVAGSSQARR